MPPKDLQNLTHRLKEMKKEMKTIKLSNPQLIHKLKELKAEMQDMKKLSKQNLKVSSRVEGKVNSLMSDPIPYCSGNRFKLTKTDEKTFSFSAEDESGSKCFLPMLSNSSWDVIINGEQTRASFSTGGSYEIYSFTPKPAIDSIITSLTIPNFFNNNLHYGPDV